jgi:hypothetical protein
LLHDFYTFMYFSCHSNGPRVSLGGRSRPEASRADLLAKSREEKKKRLQQKQQSAAATQIAVCASFFIMSSCVRERNRNFPAMQRLRVQKPTPVGTKKCCPCNCFLKHHAQNFVL